MTAPPPPDKNKGIPKLTVDSPLEVSLQDSYNAQMLFAMGSMRTAMEFTYATYLNINPLVVRIAGFEVHNPSIDKPEGENVELESRIFQGEGGLECTMSCL